jgi:hypothetical protein
MINLSFLGQYGPLGNGLKGNMKMGQCSPDFIIDWESRLINNDELAATPRIGIPPSVAINDDKLVYFPTESICRLKGDSNVQAFFNSGVGYTVLSSNRISIPIYRFAQIDPCDSGNGNLIDLSTTTVAIGVNPGESNILFYDQNGKGLNASMRRGASTFIYDVDIYYDTKQINVVAGSEN